MTANPLQRHYQPWGHDIQSPKPENTTRLYYKNTNGIRTSSLTNGLTTIYQHQKDMGVDIALYTETNTDLATTNHKANQRNIWPKGIPARRQVVL
jgi:hypothetical protein